MSGRWVAIIALGLSVLVGSSLADISNENPDPGSCLCLDGSGVNVRDSACGAVIGTANTGDCYVYSGQKVGCTLSGVFYQFFETDYGGVSGWVAGTYLVIGSASQCGAVVPPPDSEFRSLFMATVWNVDYPLSSSGSSSQHQLEMIEYLDEMADTHMNALFFQVRPAGDAFYASSLEPWSRFLTGTQGEAPSPFWDPLAFTIAEAHARGIEVHVWLNPYRANVNPNWSGLASNHMANVYREFAYPYSTYLWMDPGAQVVIDHLVSVITDIVTNYDVDGVDFDDYFYPYPDGTQFPDGNTYNSYVDNGGSLSRDDWRRDNVNRMVQRVYNTINVIKPNVKFSISPFGLYRPGHPEGMPSPITGLDPYSELYADSKLWLENGWVDILAPQLYWSIDSTGQSYPDLLDWWLDNNPLGRHIYAANGVYRLDDGSGWPVSEIVDQIEISRDETRRAKFSLGNIMYSAKYFRDNYMGITDTFRNSVYSNVATIPSMPWMGLSIPHRPQGVAVTGNVVTWQAAEGDAVRWWLVSRMEGGEWKVHSVLERSRTSVELASGVYYVAAVNAAWQYSQEVRFQV
jgi:uncharacterized lipoprotein YddW (UPF0748 family)